jgi:hypothetical protein
MHMTGFSTVYGEFMGETLCDHAGVYEFIIKSIPPS